MKKLNYLMMVALVAALSITGCKKEKVAEITITPVAQMVRVDNNTFFTELITMTNGTAGVATVNWSSSHPNIASISEYGIVEPYEVGETVITCKTKKGDFTANATLIVNPVTIDDDYATNVPSFYFGNTKINEETVETKKLITVKYHSRNKIVFAIDEVFKLSRIENIVCSMKVNVVADITTIAGYSNYKAVAETNVMIDGKSYPATIEAIFESYDDFIISIKDVPELGNVTLNFRSITKTYKID